MNTRNAVSVKNMICGGGACLMLAVECYVSKKNRPNIMSIPKLDLPPKKMIWGFRFGAQTRPIFFSDFKKVQISDGQISGIHSIDKIDP